MFIRGIVRTDGIHVHLFYKLNILYAEFFIRSSSAIGVEGVSIDAFHNKLGTVQVESVARTEINGAEADAGIHGVNDVSFLTEQRNCKPIEYRRLRSPRRYTVEMSSQQLNGIFSNFHGTVFGILGRYRRHFHGKTFFSGSTLQMYFYF